MTKKRQRTPEENRRYWAERFAEQDRKIASIDGEALRIYVARVRDGLGVLAPLQDTTPPRRRRRPRRKNK